VIRTPLHALGLALALALVLVAAGTPALAAPPGKRPAPRKDKPARTKPAPTVAGPRAPAPSRDKHVPAPGPVALTLPVVRLTLENGLRVVVNVDHASPTVGIAVVYDVGSRDEERGQSGLAHLVERRMFQGSRNVAAGDHLRLVSSHGGVAGAATRADRTVYFETLPASELALGLWLEADRMRSLDLGRDSFESQRRAVEEDHRHPTSTTASLLGTGRLEQLVYQGFWPYEHDAAGSPADLAAAKPETAQAFRAAHYGPNAAVLAIAGAVGADEAIVLVHRYFDAIPRIQAAPHPDAALPEQTSQRTAIVKDDQARTPGVLYGWAVPPAQSPDHDALVLAGVILGEGESARLHQLLVRDRGLAERVSVNLGARRGPDLFRIDAALTDGAKVGEVERIVEAEIKTLATRGPSDAEMEKARRLVESGAVLGLASNLARAQKLGEHELLFGDAALLAGELPRVFAVSKDDVKRAVAAHLGPTRRTLIEMAPADAGDAAEKPAARPPAAPRGGPAPAPKKPAGKPRKKKH
jgi:zinc protease